MHIRKRLLVALTPLLLTIAATAAFAKPPPWAPAHGERGKHHYVYYPNGEIYYAPQRNMWFWLSGNGWQAGVKLPLALKAYVRAGGVNIDLDATRPYELHADVMRRYGGHRVHWEKRAHGNHGHGRRGHNGRD